ncbi:JAB domain-containing protein [Sphingomonas ginsengisoli (ex An et al. 2013)]|uniref:JAB domain-containing protein n=1 Tax=Sphingomonas ginsengisoli (ex An et al. 2013) TaxID=363835 RepID=UPI0013B42A0D|nr:MULTISPECIES: JAB domain-containing protein [Sphingomonas]
MAHLDEDAHCLHLSAYSDGAGAHVLPARAILTDAVRIGSTGLVLAHRQARGELAPRTIDRTATRDLARAAEACDITLLDHLILAGEECASMRRMGLL